MRMTEQGIALIKAFEGFRDRAYRDPAGILTIGYGHTSAAGAPQVTTGLRMSEREAEAVLRDDVGKFSKEVVRLLRVELSDQQFSALVSFTYNVGSENLQRSSVLEAINKKDFASVPRRLALWTKAAGRVLPGLVKRRAAEAALFVGEDSGSSHKPEPQTGKPVTRSTSIWAAVIIAVLSALQAVFGDLGPILAVMIMLGISASLAWIAIERIRKIRKDGV